MQVGLLIQRKSSTFLHMITCTAAMQHHGQEVTGRSVLFVIDSRTNRRNPYSHPQHATMYRERSVKTLCTR